MALQIDKNDLVVEGITAVRRGVTYTLTLDITNRKAGGVSDAVTSVTPEVIRQSDEADVTSAFFPSGSDTFSDQSITLRPFVVPSSAAKGEHVVTVEYTAGGLNPDRPAIIFFVTD